MNYPEASTFTGELPAIVLTILFVFCWLWRLCPKFEEPLPDEPVPDGLELAVIPPAATALPVDPAQNPPSLSH